MELVAPPTQLTQEDLNALAHAKRLLEEPKLVARLSDVVGQPIERAVELLPQKWQARVGEITQQSLMTALDWAVKTMDSDSAESYPRTHKVLAAVSGGLGGAFGLAALPVELPLSTTIMLRSIAETARVNGEDLNSLETRLACVQVFALGGRAPSDDAAETGYFAARAALARALREAAEYVARYGVTQKGGPAMIRLASIIAARFKIQVTKKAAAQSLPILGAAGGAVINTIFLNHFQDISQGHFTVRRLERQYGVDVIRQAYQLAPL